MAQLQLDEMAVIGIMEHITDPTKDQGEWIAKIDLVESGDKLLVQEQEKLGECGVECKTVQRAAEEIVGDRDTDLAEELWKVQTFLGYPSLYHPCTIRRHCCTSLACCLLLPSPTARAVMCMMPYASLHDILYMICYA